MWLGTRVPKATQDVARQEGAEGDTKLACHKTMCLGTEGPKAKGLPKARGCRRQRGLPNAQACMSQGNVLRHGGA
ncbi:hypothetical protein L3X38_010944 [Prunus dulcis]|uniref:Uncharacterized protein n=1 Tax=Prunus dulcis TaxID=3755 RepID=A0AAD4WGH3_PRUDU|nr:hypothetical protein L3X38_010944 [Prunus dulcis]